MVKQAFWFRAFVFILFSVIACLLAGYIAITFRYPSLFNVTASFAEYATPLPFYWGMLHIPSLLVFGAPLVLLSKNQTKYIRYFRIFCICIFLILLLELNNKIPFLLFPKIDAFVALIFSVFIFPPSNKENPIVVKALKALSLGSVLILGYFAYSFWQHQTPQITKRQYADGLFELKSITVKNDFHKEMLFEVNLKDYISEQKACLLAQPMAKNIVRDYPFDDSYEKRIYVTFNPSNPKINFKKAYEMGEISLSNLISLRGDHCSCTE